MARLFGADGDLPNAPARFNGAPTQDMMVIRRHPTTGLRHLNMLRWGLVPSWATDPRTGPPLINARSETAATSRAFGKAWAARRCLVPVDAFYEWETLGKVKQPHAFAMTDRRPFALGALWEWWKDPRSGEEIRSFTILTTAANDLVASLHHRMPVIIAPMDQERWMAGPAHKDMLRPFPAEGMTRWPVSQRLNAVRADGADLLDPAEPLVLSLV